jgi:hypothetical protein
LVAFDFTDVDKIIYDDQSIRKLAEQRIGLWHKFSTLHGVIFEEISTTHYDNDSFYHDEHIMSLSRNERKTLLENWEI